MRTSCAYKLEGIYFTWNQISISIAQQEDIGIKDL